MTPSITHVRGRWQVVTQVAATRTTTDYGPTQQRSNLLVEANRLECQKRKALMQLKKHLCGGCYNE